MLHEISHGQLAVRQAMAATESSGLAFELRVNTDARNLVAALRGNRVKALAEKSFITHLLWLKDKLQAGVIKQLVWKDTRDMTADGHTKGSISRDALRNLCRGV